MRIPSNAMRLGVLVLVLAALAAPGRAAACRSLAVTKDPSPFKHYVTIQKAVNVAKPCDWILVAPGIYRESITIKKDHIHLRGLNRNTVIVDGVHAKNANGIVVDKANDVWIENLTVRNFDRADRDGENGNQIWWNGGDESGQIGAKGWHGNYLTAYDDGLLGGYGLFTSNSVNGEWDHVYASGFNDSGLYLGACPDCNATISHALAENNAIGYSGTNSGGRLVVQDSLFRNNGVGVVPNSLPNDAPPPQLGTCDAGSNTSPTPTIASTGVARCTVFRRNRIVSNGNITTPANSTTAQIPWGIGLLLLGAYGDLVTSNVITGNPNFGLLGIENPVPFPPTPKTLYFQLSGNKVVNNTISGGKYADLAFEGGLFGPKQSVNNCFSGNRVGKSLPADLSAWSCSLQTTPNADPATTNQVFTTVLQLMTESRARRQQLQPPPPPQPTMPRPCTGPPGRSPLCYG
jgi:hypothetical protein